MGVILILSLFPFRKKAYEFFLFCHIVCAVLFLVFLYQYVSLPPLLSSRYLCGSANLTVGNSKVT